MILPTNKSHVLNLGKLYLNFINNSNLYFILKYISQYQYIYSYLYIVVVVVVVVVAFQFIKFITNLLYKNS